MSRSAAAAVVAVARVDLFAGAAAGADCSHGRVFVQTGGAVAAAGAAAAAAAGIAGAGIGGAAATVVGIDFAAGGAGTAGMDPAGASVPVGVDSAPVFAPV